jgi:hypothetical protein
MLMHIIINLLHSTSISFYKYKKSLRKKKGSMATLSVRHLHCSGGHGSVTTCSVQRGAPAFPKSWTLQELNIKVGYCG